MSAVTLQGHPVEGWRYWRVEAIGTNNNDVLIETGAADLPPPGTKNFWGYYYFVDDQLEIWHQYLEFILRDIKKLDPNATEGHTVETSPQGWWNGADQVQVLNFVCGALQGQWCN